MRRLRCAPVRSVRAPSDPRFCHGWELELPCGKTTLSRAQEPPVTVAAKWVECNSCPAEKRAREDRQRPAFMW